MIMQIASHPGTVLLSHFLGHKTMIPATVGIGQARAISVGIISITRLRHIVHTDGGQTVERVVGAARVTGKAKRAAAGLPDQAEGGDKKRFSLVLPQGAKQGKTIQGMTADLQPVFTFPHRPPE